LAEIASIAAVMLPVIENYF